MSSRGVIAIGVVASVTLSVLGHPVIAQERLLGDLKIARACAGDVVRLCTDVLPGRGRIKECIKDRLSQLSPSCLEAVGASIAGDEPTAAVSSRTYKFQTAMPPGVVAPNTIETRFGTLNLLDGIPDKVSAEKLYDNLDFQHAVQAYLLGLPAVNQVGNRSGILQMGPGQHDRTDLGANG